TFAGTVTAILGRLAISLPLMLALALGAGNVLAETVIFSDDFTGPNLNAAWQVLPGNGSYSLAGGQLRYFNDGPQASTTGWLSPALTLALPFTGTNWEIQTKATYSLQWLDSSGNSSGAQGQEVLVKFNPSVTTSSFGGPNYAGTDYTVIERDIDAYYGANYLSASYGAVYNGNLLNPADATVTNNIADGTYWYDIIRDGGALTIKYSNDGVNYANAFSTTLSNPSSSYNELLLGGNTWATVGSHADYDYVHITGAVPEPSGFVPLALCFVAVGLNWFRRKTAPLAEQQ
ncbi:MAG: hypothetical protein ACRD9L_06580, partial [Bryobacteraceae bacterium]